MPSKTPWFTAVQATAGDAAEVAIRGIIGDWDITDTDFIGAVEALGDVPEILVRINCRGGDTNMGLGIYSYLSQHPARVTCRVDGVAMSAASIVAMAADEIIMPANTLMMVHNPWTFAMGNAADLRAEADVLDKYGQALIATYCARTGKTADEVKALLDAETYLTAQEAVDAGFADVCEPIKSSTGAGAQARAYAFALGIPAEVLARVQATARAHVAADDPSPPPPAAPQSTVAVRIVALATEAGLADYGDHFALAYAEVEQARTAIAQATEIRDLCIYAQVADQAAAHIRAGRPLAEVRAALLAARADAADAHPTDGHIDDPHSTPPATAPQAVKTGSIWAQRRTTQLKKGA